MAFRYGSLVTLSDDPIEEVVGIDFTATRAAQARAHHIAPSSEESIPASGAFVDVLHGCLAIPPGSISVVGCDEGARFCIDIVLHDWGAVLIYVDGSGESVELPAVLEITLSPSEPSTPSSMRWRRAHGSFSASGGRNDDRIEGTFSLLVEDRMVFC